ncbi:hypothetical protein [Pedobacter sp. NJ-S-72]
MCNYKSLIKSALSLFLILITALISCDHKYSNIASLNWFDKADIYMGGELSDSTTYWKNGKAISLDKKGMFANAVTVSGKDTYLAGFIAIKDSLTNNSTARAVYSKNEKYSFFD